MQEKTSLLNGFMFPKVLLFEKMVVHCESCLNKWPFSCWSLEWNHNNAKASSWSWPQLVPNPLPVGFISSLYASEFNTLLPFWEVSSSVLLTTGHSWPQAHFHCLHHFLPRICPPSSCCVLKHFFLSSLTSSPTCYFWSQLLSKLPTRERSEPLLFYLGKGEV